MEYNLRHTIDKFYRNEKNNKVLRKVMPWIGFAALTGIVGYGIKVGYDITHPEVNASAILGDSYIPQNTYQVTEKDF